MADKNTIIEHPTITPPSDKSGRKDHGWLTDESYVAWLATTSGVFIGDRPFVQPSLAMFAEALDEVLSEESLSATEAA